MILPKEYEQRIEQEATHHANVEIGDIGKINDMHTVTKWDACKDDYTAGATRHAMHYRTLQQEKERLREALEKINTWCKDCGLKEVAIDNMLHMAIYHCLHESNAALTAQPEADNQQNENV